MSMFHELMMRKKEQIMYATIKGTLTENDGVFSGFSASNYLQGNVTDKNLIAQNYLTNFGFQVKASLPPNSISSEEQIIHIPYRGILSGIIIRTNGKIIWYAMGGTNVITSSTTFSFGTTIWIKGTINNNVATLYSSIDGTNWITEGSINLDNLEATSTYPMRIGVNGGTTVGYAFTGSIDLNNSYIKLGSTKYNLQAVVGYTIVGSPTIVDGVASGFSSENYLTLPTINISEGTPFNIITKISTPADYQGNWLLAFVTSSSRIYCLSQAPVFRYLSNGTATNLSFNYTMVFNTTYILEVKYDGNKLKVIIYDENKNILSSNEVEDTKVVFFNGSYTIGSNKSNQFFNGSIYLNETEIKINNKLWFNGQQA